MTEKPERIRLGIIGCGIIATEGHVPALERLSDCYEVTALCNRTEPKAAALADRLGLDRERIWLDWGKMLEEAPVDAVLIALPIDLNFPVSLAAARAGKHVICEKPIGQSIEEAKTAAGLSGRYGITYLAAENCHYQPTYAKAAHLAGQGAIGELKLMVWSELRFMNLSSKYARTAWRLNHVYPGGFVLDGGVHYAHVLQMVAGRVSSVSARTMSIEPALGKVDTAFAVLTHESGVISSLNLSWRARDRQEQLLRIYGTGGTLLADENKLIRLDTEGREQEVPFVEEDSIYLELLDFYRAVTRAEQPEIEAGAAAHDVAVILALLESSERGCAVEPEL